MRAWAVLALLVLLAGPAAAAPAPGDPVPPFTLAQLDGTRFHWQPGTVTVFSFLAFWCDTWKTQAQSLAAASKALAGLPVAFLTISVDDRWSERAQGKLAGTTLVDPDRSLSRSLGIDGIPYLLIVDTRGRVRTAARGVTRAAALARAVRDVVLGASSPPEATVYLVFDDFPAQDASDLDDRLLDVLRQAQAKATFFCIGQRVAPGAAVVRRAAREGHSLHIHSWDHRAAEPQLTRCVQALQETAGVTPTLYHPPGSSEFQRLSGQRLPFTVVNPYDYLRPGAPELRRRVLLAAKPGSVVLLHAGVAETVDALPDLLRTLRSRGLTFATLE